MITWQHIKDFLTSPKEGKSKAEQILGSQKTVDKFAGFWMNEGEGIMLLSASLLHAFVSKNTFTPAEKEAYQKALTDTGKFFELCYKENQTRNKTSKMPKDVI